MKCQIIISSPAAKDVRESFVRYEGISAGLGSRFIDFVDKVLSVIEMYPESFPIKHRTFREASIKRFPYLIVYEYSADNQTAYVLHFFNTTQHPHKKYPKSR